MRYVVEIRARVDHDGARRGSIAYRVCDSQPEAYQLFVRLWRFVAEGTPRRAMTQAEITVLLVRLHQTDTMDDAEAKRLVEIGGAKLLNEVMRFGTS